LDQRKVEAEAKGDNYTATNKMFGVVSMILSNLWKMMPEEEKKAYNAKARTTTVTQNPKVNKDKKDKKPHVSLT